MGAGILIPLYVYPDTGAWDSVVATKVLHPSVPVVAIVNVNSGPGTTPNPNYVGGISYLKKYGVTVVGYVDTAYGSKPTLSVMSEMDLWTLWYKVDGFFFDDVADTGQEAYLTTINVHAASSLTIGNPGVPIPSSYSGTLDNFVTYENSGLPSFTGTSGESCICYSVPSFAMPNVGFSYVYVTNASMPNPYNLISPYMGQMATSLESIRVLPATQVMITESIGVSIIHPSPITQLTVTATNNLDTYTRNLVIFVDPNPFGVYKGNGVYESIPTFATTGISGESWTVDLTSLAPGPHTLYLLIAQSGGPAFGTYSGSVVVGNQTLSFSNVDVFHPFIFKIEAG